MLQEYLDQLFDAFKEGICISDVEGTVVHLNRRHAEITGIPREEMLGHSVMEFVKRGRLDVVLNPEVIRTGQPVTRVQTVSDGRKLILEANPVFDAQGKLVLCITFLRDVTMLSEMREQMSVQKELLEAFQQLSTAGDAQELSRKTPKLFTSSAMIKLYGEVNTIAETDATVLLLGETGVGKDVIARRIHALSLRKNKTFIKVDCGSIPENLIETELFGYAAGTFSGASKTGKIGLIEAASGGTLFLDEIGDMSLKTQAKILRILQEQSFERVGGTRTIKVDVRVIAATNKNLEEAIAAGTFREDLYYRLRVVPLHLPPLRERGGDLDLLLAAFTERLCRVHACKAPVYAPETMERLRRYPWPGNVRELRNFAERMVILFGGKTVLPVDLPPEMIPQGKPEPSAEAASAACEPAFLPQSAVLDPDLDFKKARAVFEARYLEAKLHECGGNITRLAETIGLERSYLHRKLKGYGISSE